MNSPKNRLEKNGQNGEKKTYSQTDPLIVGAMNGRDKAKIIQALRKLSLQFRPRNDAKNKQKLDTCLYTCNNCGVHIYDGKSETNFIKLRELYPNIVWGGIMDHIIPVVDVATGCQSWDQFIASLFCPEDNWQFLCTKCSDEKTEKENKQRQLN